MRVLSDGRVRRTEAEWRRLLQKFESSELSAAAFCRREKITRSAFTQWRRRLGDELAKPGAPRMADFVELPIQQQPARRPAERLEAGELELSLPGRVVLRWRP